MSDATEPETPRRPLMVGDHIAHDSGEYLGIVTEVLPTGVKFNGPRLWAGEGNLASFDEITRAAAPEAAWVEVTDDDGSPFVDVAIDRRVDDTSPAGAPNVTLHVRPAAGVRRVRVDVGGIIYELGAPDQRRVATADRLIIQRVPAPELSEG